MTRVMVRVGGTASAGLQRPPNQDDATPFEHFPTEPIPADHTPSGERGEPARLPQVVSQDVAVFTVTVAARLAGMHPQTLRTYDRLGLVVPQRTRGSGRRYAPRDVGKLRLIQRLSHDEGINLEGIRRIIDLTDRLDEAQARIDHLTMLAQHLMGDPSLTRVFTAKTDGNVWPDDPQSVVTRAK